MQLLPSARPPADGADRHRGDAHALCHLRLLAARHAPADIANEMLAIAARRGQCHAYVHGDVMLLHSCDLDTLKKGDALGALVDAKTLEVDEEEVAIEGGISYFVSHANNYVIVASNWGDQSLVLYDVDGYSAKEIAAMTDTAENTVYSRVRLAREAFRRRVVSPEEGAP